MVLIDRNKLAQEIFIVLEVVKSEKGRLMGPKWAPISQKGAAVESSQIFGR